MIIIESVVGTICLVAVAVFCKRRGIEMKYYGLGTICLAAALLFAVFSTGSVATPMANGGYVFTTGPLITRGLASLGFSIAGALCILASAVARTKDGKECPNKTIDGDE